LLIFIDFVENDRLTDAVTPKIQRQGTGVCMCVITARQTVMFGFMSAAAAEQHQSTVRNETTPLAIANLK